MLTEQGFERKTLLRLANENAGNLINEHVGFEEKKRI